MIDTLLLGGFALGSLLLVAWTGRVLLARHDDRLRPGDWLVLGATLIAICGCGFGLYGTGRF